ncbi:hypothetical protein OH77DRAFT_1434524 [Trametes cingulata]|nr:hypothetical protein OH77DRAFT_1434524 [Trametes cingulata]
MTSTEIDEKPTRVRPRLTATKLRLRVTLLHLSMTCKAFAEPALDALWMRLDDLHPFMRLTPKVRELNAEPHLSEQDFDVAVDDDEWELFQRYARRVRVLHYHSPHSMSSPYDVVAWTRLSRRAGGAPLFPRLRCLRPVTVIPSIIGLFLEAALLSPFLRRVSVRIMAEATQGNSNEPALQAIKDLQSLMPRLERLTINFERNSIQRMSLEPFVPTLCAFKQLRHLALKRECTLDHRGLAQLSQLTSLEVLSTNIALPFDRDAPLPPDLDFGAFPALRRVSLRGRAEHLAALFSGSQMPHLESLALQLVRRSTGLAPDAAFAASVARILHAVPATLTSLTLTSMRRHAWLLDLDGPDTREPLVALLAPALERMRGLRTLAVEFSCLPAVDDAAVAQMLDAWPALVELRIHGSLRPGRGVGASGGALEPPLPTLHTLVTVATRYPKLRSLELPQTDVEMAGALAAEAASLTTHHALQTLVLAPHVDDEKDKDDEDDYWERRRGKGKKARVDKEQWKFDVALLVDRLFPHLDLPPSTHCDGLKWGAVLEYLVCMQAGRRHAQLLNTVEPRTVVEMRKTEDLLEVRVGW